MTTDTTYNGWKNWETWNVALWLRNDEPLYRECYRYANQYTGIDAHDAQSFVLDVFPGGTPDMDSQREMRHVDWEEIAEMLEKLAA